MSGMIILKYPFASGLVVEDVVDQGSDIADVECYLAGVTVQDVIDQGSNVADVESVVKLGNFAHYNELTFGTWNRRQSIGIGGVVVEVNKIGSWF